jgi:hypothetical protein
MFKQNLVVCCVNNLGTCVLNWETIAIIHCNRIRTMERVLNLEFIQVCSEMGIGAIVSIPTAILWTMAVNWEGG